MGKLRRILLVEDDPDMRALSVFALTDIGGFSVEACQLGEEAIQKAPIFAPDLILLDVGLPDLEGPAVLERMRKLDKVERVPIIFLTAKVLREEHSFYMSCGAAAIITKPFRPHDLIDQIYSVWRQAHAE